MAYRLSRIAYRKKQIWFLFVACLSVSLFGCAGLGEGIKGFLGISTKVLEEGRKDAVTKIINYDYTTCYKMTLNALKEMGSYVYAKNMNKHMIAVYRSKEDTTPVGIFFKEIDAKKTQIEVTSPSRFTRAEAAQKIFAAFEEKEATAPAQPKNEEEPVK